MHFKDLIGPQTIEHLLKDIPQTLSTLRHYLSYGNQLERKTREADVKNIIQRMIEAGEIKQNGKSRGNYLLIDDFYMELFGKPAPSFVALDVIYSRAK